MKKLTLLLLIASHASHSFGATATATASIGAASNALKAGRSRLSRAVRTLFIFGTGYTLARNGNNENVEASLKKIIETAQTKSGQESALLAGKELLAGSINLLARGINNLDQLVKNANQNNGQENTFRTGHPHGFTPTQTHTEQHHAAAHNPTMADWDPMGHFSIPKVNDTIPLNNDPIEYDSEGKALFTRTTPSENN